MLVRELPTAEAVERALDAVFARPEFAPVQPSPIARWLGRLWDRVRELLAELFRIAGADERLANRLVIGLLIVAAAIIAFYLIRTGYALWRGRERGRGRAAAPAPGTTPPQAEEWELHARAAAGAGRWREAVLALYQALLLRLDAAGAVRYDPAKTPGDYRREAGRESAARRALDAFLPSFEPLAYGGRAADAAAYDSLRRAAQEAGAHG